MRYIPNLLNNSFWRGQTKVSVFEHCLILLDVPWEFWAVERVFSASQSAMRNTGTNCACCLCCYDSGKWMTVLFWLLREPFLELISCNMFPHSFDNRCVKILNWKVIDGNVPSAVVRDMSTMAENCSINHESLERKYQTLCTCALNQPCFPYTLTLKRHCPLHAPIKQKWYFHQINAATESWKWSMISTDHQLLFSPYAFPGTVNPKTSTWKHLLTGKHAGFNLNTCPVFKQPVWGITRSQNRARSEPDAFVCT